MIFIDFNDSNDYLIKQLYISYLEATVAEYELNGFYLSFYYCLFDFSCVMPDMTAPAVCD